MSFAFLFSWSGFEPRFASIADRRASPEVTNIFQLVSYTKNFKFLTTNIYLDFINIIYVFAYLHSIFTQIQVGD